MLFAIFLIFSYTKIRLIPNSKIIYVRTHKA